MVGGVNMFVIYLNGKKVTEVEHSTFSLKGLRPGDNEVKVVELDNEGNELTAETIIIKSPGTMIKDVVEKVKTSKNVTVEDLEPFKGKAGWYTFEDGHKVRGEDAALEYLKGL